MVRSDNRLAKRRGRFAGDKWFQKIVENRTRAALNARHREFAESHQCSSDESLLAYVRGEAERLGCSPDVGEIIGGRYIAQRFHGSWQQVMNAAGLPYRSGSRKVTKCRVYKEEFARQAALFRRERAEEKEKRMAANRERSAVAAELYRQRTARDLQWGEAHGGNSDEWLLSYICRCAGELGHTPFEREVLGGVYISQRFCGWAVALHLAGLPLPRGINPPKPSALKAYEKQAAEREAPCRAAALE